MAVPGICDVAEPHRRCAHPQEQQSCNREARKPGELARVSPPLSYAKSGTDVAYAATIRPTQCTVQA
eukprot:466584-Rhodomonas_salina.7